MTYLAIALAVLFGLRGVLHLVVLASSSVSYPRIRPPVSRLDDVLSFVVSATWCAALVYFLNKA